MLDPRVVTVEAAEVAIRHGLDVVAALVASALHQGAQVRLGRPNVGRQWPDVLQREGIELTVV